ncbi:acyl-CoA carboxylase subunit epsilon [Microbacterium sp. SLBN-146]|uniref:acyl-CoA carboxylase subunit epsilon n=1 Tax=Microbacterium sp. SLBN-146 TaxID=2768457 RepID=UPI0011544A0F|nr:acyl-CoA carboxylase subunit epsilon [Microbacterium sp. SLBN-146]TQJ32746.1 acyl-CoA carboxylase epsilon subunit-like protein [Microbacterium sp. SLBN-146]
MSAAQDETVAVEVRRGDPTPEELAALVAVVTEAYEREAETAVVDETRRPSAWSRSQRALRTPLRRDIGWSPWA